MKRKFVMILLLLLMICPSVYADNSSDADSWQVALTPYFFAPSVDFTSTVSGQSMQIDLSFSDVLDDFDVWGVSARVEAWKGKVGLIFDGSYLDLETDATMLMGPATIDADADISDSALDFAVGYRFVYKPLGNGSRTLTIEPFAGGRYHYLKQEIRLKADISTPAAPIPLGTTLGESEDWVEPLVGGRIVLVLTEKLKFLFRVDWSGFGIGSASDLTYNVVAGLDFQPWEKTSLKLGYRHYDMDYERGSGTQAFGFDGKMYGPQVGVTYYF